METIINSIVNAGKYLATIGIWDVVDILIVAFLIYTLIGLVRRTSTARLAKGIVLLVLALWLSGVLRLNIINFLLRTAFEIGLIAIIVIFQPELRRVLEKVGSSKVGSLFSYEGQNVGMDSCITQIVLACTDMSKSRTGALIVFERDNPLSDQVRTGTIIHADATSELIKNIFFVKAPLHDGALIVRDGRLEAAGCMLPLSNNSNLSRDLGMRHRAGIGMSEHSDAVVVIVSEETGAISVAVDGMLKRHLSAETFETILRNELIVDSEEKNTSITGRIIDLFKGNRNEKENNSK